MIGETTMLLEKPTWALGAPSATYLYHKTQLGPQQNSQVSQAQDSLAAHSERALRGHGPRPEYWGGRIVP
jgi:hypothetical protein